MEIRIIASSSSGNCYQISDGNTSLLLECGCPFKKIQRALDFMLSSLSGCLVSHDHGDHARAVKDVMKTGVDCYMSRGTADALGLDCENHRLHYLTVGVQRLIGSWQVLPLETIHDSAEPLGFLLVSGENRVLFATDTAYIKPRFQGLTHILIECNYQRDIVHKNIESGALSPALYKRLLGSHMGLDTVLDFLAANDLSKVREIHLLHLSDANTNAEECKRAVQSATGKPTYVCAK